MSVCVLMTRSKAPLASRLTAMPWSSIHFQLPSLQRMRCSLR